MRRTHRKSRRGCLECKRRHIKCDESQPQCLNCVTVQRSCSYPDNFQASAVPTLRSDRAASDSASPNSRSRETSDPEISTLEQNGNQSLVNMEHLELFHHVLSENSFLSIFGEHAAGKPFKVVVEAALSNPYLMHLMLSLASLHLSIIRPARQSFYREQAAQLQSRAISMLNSTKVEVTVENAVPLLLFSSCLGIHVLGEMIMYRDNSFNGFMDQFTNYLRLHRGVRAITGQSWSYLRETELKPVLLVMDSVPRTKENRGSDCNDLVSLLEAADLSPPSIQSCQEAVDNLQWLFDGVNMIGGDRSTTSMIHAWPVLVSEEYAQLLTQRKPEALVILAYYGVLLHRHREYWFFSDGGSFLIKSITGYLGPYWEKWLAWPNRILETSSPPATDMCVG